MYNYIITLKYIITLIMSIVLILVFFFFPLKCIGHYLVHVICFFKESPSFIFIISYLLFSLGVLFHFISSHLH